MINYIRRAFKTKTEALNGLAQLTSEVRGGAVVEPDKLTVGELLDQWLKWKAPRDLRETTRSSYEREIRLRLKPLLGPVKVQALRKTDIEKAYLLMREPKDDHRGNGNKVVVSVETLAVAARVLKQALKEWGVERGVILKNPADTAKLPKVREQRGEAGGGRAKYEPYTAVELKRFLEVTLDHPLFVGFFLAGFVGLREGEVVGLRWGDVKIDAHQLNERGGGELRVNRQRTRSGGSILEGPPKSEQSKRPFPLTSNAVTVLRLHRDQQKEWAKDYGWKWSPDGYVVVSQKTGLPIRGESLWKSFRTQTRRLGMRPVAFHDLRHGFVSIMASEGVPLEVISKLVGHHSASFTAEAYRHVFSEEGAAATAVMDKVSPDLGVSLMPLTQTDEEKEGEPAPVSVRRKLTPYQVRRIRERIRAGERPEDVALDYGVSGRMARLIVSGERHAEVQEQTTQAV